VKRWEVILPKIVMLCSFKTLQL